MNGSEAVDPQAILGLLGCVVFRVTDAGEVTPLGANAEQLVVALADATSPAVALFDVAPEGAAAELARRGRFDADVHLSEGGEKQFRWDALADTQPGEVLCMAVDWEPLRPMIERLRTQSLQFKEIVLNVLPQHVVDALLANKAVRPRAYRRTSILFADVVGFSKLSTQLDPVTLIRTLDEYFGRFDETMALYRLVKIKTVGDCYIGVAGIPEARPSHAVDMVLAAFGMLAAVSGAGQVDAPRPGAAAPADDWSFRLGIHSGPCIAGVVGRLRHHFDIWGQSVNDAARVQEAAAPGRIAVSSATWALVEPFFDAGADPAGEVVLVDGLKPTYADDDARTTPNAGFVAAYRERFYPKLTAPAASVPELLRLAASS